MTKHSTPELQAAIGGDIMAELEKLKRGKLPPSLSGPPTRNPLVAPAIILALALVVVASIIAAAFGRYAVKAVTVGPQPHVVIVDRVTGAVRACDVFVGECALMRAKGR